MKKTAATPKKTSQFASATAIRTPQWPRDLEQIRQRAEALYAARTGMIGLTPHDWLKAELELKQTN